MVLALAIEAAVYTGDLRRCREAFVVAHWLGVAPPGALAGLCAAVEGRYEDARAVLKASAGRCGPGGDPTLLIHSGIAALMLGDHTRAATATLRAAASARARGTPVTAVQAMEFRAYADFWTGRTRAAEAAAQDALGQAYATGQDNGACHLRAALATFAAVTGDEDACRERAGPPARTPSPAAWACPPRWPSGRSPSWTSAAAGTPPPRPGCVQSPNSGPVTVTVPSGTWPPRTTWRPPHAPGTPGSRAPPTPTTSAGRAPSAAPTTRRSAPAAGPCSRPAPRPWSTTARPSTCTPVAPATSNAPARNCCSRASALEAFESFGAPHCAAQARAELRVLGTPVQAPAARDPAALLTAQQLMVARMAAEGATNREIADRLALSPRTVDHHLRGVFARLGIRSRIELVRLLAQGAG